MALAVFRRMGAQLGAKMADMYGKVDKAIMVDEWASALRGMTFAELDAGMAACATRRFAPTLGEFAQLCRPSLDPEIAWDEAVAGLAARSRGEVGAWSHPAVWRAAMALWQDVRSSTFRLCRNRWEHRLRIEFAAGWGDGVQNPMKLIANKARVSGPSPEFIRKLKALGFRVGKGS